MKAKKSAKKTNLKKEPRARNKSVLNSLKVKLSYARLKMHWVTPQLRSKHSSLVRAKPLKNEMTPSAEAVRTSRRPIVG